MVEKPNLSLTLSLTLGNAEFKRDTVGSCRPGFFAKEKIEGEVDIKEIFHQTTLPNLAVIPAGRVPPNPTEMLHSRQMRTLLHWCKQEGICAILDAPAVLPVVDATVAGSLVSGTIFVVSAEETYREAAKAALEQLVNNGISLLGVVMQKVPLANIPRHFRGSLYHFPKEIPKEPRNIVMNE